MTVSAATPPEVRAYLSDLVSALRRLRSDLVGVYLHGSAALGGFRPASSDVDVLVVVLGSGSEAVQQAMGEVIAAVGGCPGAGVELSVLPAATAAELGDCRFEVHVNTTGRQPVIVPGAGRTDPDLVLHCAVCRDHAITVIGTPARAVFGPVPRHRILEAMRAELDWALGHASTAYAVLNACRAVRFAEEARLCSKVDGGEWFLIRRGDDPVVRAALDFQRHGRGAPPVDAATVFVDDVRRRLRDLPG